SDPLDGNNFFGIWITAIPNATTQGTLVDNGHVIVAGDLVNQSSNTSISPNTFSGYFVSAARITLGQLQFVPALNRNNTSAASLMNFRVEDDGPINTGAGGDNVALADNIFSISLTPVNDAPAGTNKTIPIPEDTTYTFSTTNSGGGGVGTTDFGFTDPSDTNPPSSTSANSLLNVIITSLP